MNKIWDKIVKDYIETRPWLAQKLPDSLLGGAIVKGFTTLGAQLKKLPLHQLDHVQRILANGGYSGYAEMLVDRPAMRALWVPTKVRRLVRNKCVTTVFVNDIVDTLESSVAAFSLFKYHHSGTGTGAEAVGDTGLGTPRESARDVGTQVDGASANIYKSVATTTYTNTWAITEHGLFNTAGTGGPPVTGGDLMDRTLFAAINVVSTNQIEWTFTITFTAGG
jgi:hypothetical protein